MNKTPDQLINVEFQYLDNHSSQNRKRLVTFACLFILAFIMTRFILEIRLIKKKMGGGGRGNFMNMMDQKSKLKIYDPTTIKTRFKDVAGLQEAKLEITEFVDFLKNPQKYLDLGAKIPKGALLSGPPGVGKTLLAKAVAGEAGVPIIAMSGSDFVEMYVGVGASRVRELFATAKKKSPSIIFIDEMDAVGKKRNSFGNGNVERDNTLNQLLVELDGFESSTNVIILAATNMVDSLDPALLRPGRFDRLIDIQKPDLGERQQIFGVHLKPLNLDPQHNIKEYKVRLATLTPGFTGADIANLCNEAAILAARKNKDYIEAIDFELASERIIAGLELKRFAIGPEKTRAAVHESGHAIASWLLEGGQPLIKITIIPRAKGQLGFTQYLPNEQGLETKEDLLDRICTILGGRIAEEIFFSSVSTGATDDLKEAYNIAYKMVKELGMSDKIGYIGYQDNEYKKSYSDETSQEIDQEIYRIIKDQIDKCRKLLLDNKHLIQKLSDKLIEKDTIDLRQIIEVLGKRPFPPKSNFKKYLEIHEQIYQEIQKNLEKEKLQEDNQPVN